VGNPELPIDELEATFSRRERRALVRTVVLTSIPVVAAALLLWLTIDRVRNTEQKLKRVNSELAEASRARDAAWREVASLRADLERDQASLRSVQAQLRESSNLVRREHQVNLTDLKFFATELPAAGDLLSEIYNLRQSRWGLANTLKGGFDSPGFAGYVLQRVGRLPKTDPEQALSKLPRSGGRPFIGDVILYETGFAMFYFRDFEGRPYVMGMTPVGVLALEPSFGPRRLAVFRTGITRS
jgi:hypothetical protein